MSVQPPGPVDTAASPVPPASSHLSPPTGLSPEEQEQRVARWTRILSGEEEPDYLVPPPEVVEIVDAQVERLYQLHHKHITAEAKQRMLDYLTMQYHCGGRWVAFIETPRGKAVLAAGNEEIALLRQRVDSSLQSRGTFGYIEPWWRS
jgi:hypothetical protein